MDRVIKSSNAATGAPQGINQTFQEAAKYAIKEIALIHGVNDIFGHFQRAGSQVGKSIERFITDLLSIGLL